MPPDDDTPQPPVLPPRVPDDDDAPAGNACGNCGTPLRGEYCYVCGQPIHGLVRHFSSIAGDFFDTVLNYDARLPRTLWPLFARPAFLTREYFAGRRVRYVSPVRLFVTLSIVTFFVAQLMLSFGNDPIELGGGGGGNGFRKAGTVADVVRQRDAALKEMEDARKGKDGHVPGLNIGLRSAEAAIRRSAAERIAELEKQGGRASTSGATSSNDAGDEAADAGDPAAGNAASEADAAAERSVTQNETAPARDAPPAKQDAAPATASTSTHAHAVEDADSGERDRATKDDASDDDVLTMFPIDGKPWNPATNPVAISWLPAFANHALNALTLRAKHNIQRMQKDPDQFKDAVLSAVPSTLFVLLPVFALLLKLFYAFRRRLYMEHLIVALHSHAFLCMALLLMFGAMALRNALAVDGGGFWHGVLGWIEGLLWIWMPAYLLLMQKRVYAQGWPMTLLKYTVLGWCYFFLLTFGAVFTVMFSVVYG